MDCSPERTLRRSSRPRRSTAKALDFQELNANKSYRGKSRDASSDHSMEEKYSDEEGYKQMQVTDTVLTTTALAGKEIYSFDKVKKHEKFIATPQKKTPKIHQKLPKTPHHLRDHLKKGIKSTLDSSGSSESDNDVFEDSGSEFTATQSEPEDSSSDTASDDEEDFFGTKTIATRKQPPRHSINTNMKNKPSNKKHNYIIKTEEYFQHTNNKVTTSNHTLDKLKTPRLSQDQLQKLLAQLQLSKQHQKAVCNFAQGAKDNFPKWLCLLHENFNILLYGLGSKKTVLNEFHEMLTDDPVMVINGFFPSLTLRDILDAIANDLLGLPESSANVYETVELIGKTMQAVDKHLYLIIHNIEGDMLRNNKAQNVLSRLGAIPNVHLIASIDHINAPLIWDHNKLSKFNFVWFDVTSFLPYSDETSYESSMMVQRTGNLALSSLRNVFLSLTSNSKGIYKIIVKYQLEHNTNQYYQGMLFKDLYIACREEFVVSSDLALRAQLTEFVDHKMVKYKRSAEGAENLIIPIANNLLQQFMIEQNK